MSARASASMLKRCFIITSAPQPGHNGFDEFQPFLRFSAAQVEGWQKTHNLRASRDCQQAGGVQEICEFAKRMGFKKIGIATCISFVDHAKILSGILESHGFEVASVACKHGGIPKEELGLKDAEKIRPGNFEAICNPVGQAELLKRAGCEFNVVLGLCVGHDSLFFRHAKGLTTVLVAKDRVLGHNPVAALQLADTYYSRVWGPHKPAQPRKLPVAGRRSATK